MAIEVPHGGKRKSMAVALVLTFFFGLFGLLYANWKVACAVIGAWLAIFVAIFVVNPEVEISLVVTFLVTAASMAAAWFLVDRHNKEIDAFEAALARKRQVERAPVPAETLSAERRGREEAPAGAADSADTDGNGVESEESK